MLSVLFMDFYYGNTQLSRSAKALRDGYLAIPVVSEHYSPDLSRMFDIAMLFGLSPRKGEHTSLKSDLEVPSTKT
jgi:hypothetical protein